MRTATSPNQRSCVLLVPAVGGWLTPSPIWRFARRRRPRSSRPEYPADLSGAMVELVVEVDRGGDQGQVAERLREVAQLLPGAADLLRIQAQMVGVGEHLLEDEPRLIQPPRAGQDIDVPERAQSEDA